MTNFDRRSVLALGAAAAAAPLVVSSKAAAAERYGPDEGSAALWREAMTVFLIAEVRVTDDSWVPDYAVNVHKLVDKHGGKYLSRSGNVSSLEGDADNNTLIALLQFPSAEALQAFASDPEYAPYAKARQAGSVSRLRMIDDSDLAGAIPYLPKG